MRFLPLPVTRATRDGVMRWVLLCSRKHTLKEDILPSPVSPDEGEKPASSFLTKTRKRHRNFLARVSPHHYSEDRNGLSPYLSGSIRLATIRLTVSPWDKQPFRLDKLVFAR